MRILFAAPSPDAAGGLPLALKKAGHEVAVLLPFDVSASRVAKPTKVRIPLRVGAQTIHTAIFQASTPDRVACYLGKAETMLAPGSVGEAIWYSQLVVELARRLTPSPDILHLSGWQAGLAPAYARAAQLPFRFMHAAGRARDEGAFGPEDFALANLPGELFSPQGVEFHGRLHFPKAAAQLAAVVTVESTLAVLSARAEGDRFAAFLGGPGGKVTTADLPLADEDWNPSTDEQIVRRFRASSPGGKSACRTALLATLGLKSEPRGAVLVLNRALSPGPLREVGEILGRLLADDTRVIVLGAAAVESPALEHVARRAPGRVALVREPDESLHRQTLAGADAAWFPHPQVAGLDRAIHIAMRYGAIPLAPAQPGLGEIFRDLRGDWSEGEGIACARPDLAGWWDAFGTRLRPLLLDPTAREIVIQAVMKRAAARNWSASAARHAEIFEGMIRAGGGR